MSEYLQLQGITKRFPGVTALDNITVCAAEGSVHALMGENGAGKSTLLKILSGVYTPDSGEIVIQTQRQRFKSPIDAIAGGIAVIYQELNLVPEMTVAENLLLGQMPHRIGWIRKKEMLARAENVLATLGEQIDPGARMRNLSIAQQQMVEIAKALLRDARIIAFDEPTSSLTEREIRKLFSIISDLKQSGRVILYVSHRMQEIFEICDTVTVMRDGRVVETFHDMTQLNHDRLVNCMVGRNIEDVYSYAPREYGESILEVKGLRGNGLNEPIDLSLRKGEILGLFGLVGAGRTEFLKLLFGAVKPAGGSVLVAGRPVRLSNPRDAIRAGIMLVPEDRKKEGIIPGRSVKENINLSVRRTFSTLGFLNERRENANAMHFAQLLQIRAHSLVQLTGTLSGGNQQKVVLARWLSENVKVLLLDEPTRGIDIGAKSEIYSLIRKLAAEGTGVIVVSSDLPEVLGVCDRILVMREGRIAASFSRDEATEQGVLQQALPSCGTSSLEGAA